jgi:hypothetical protein
MCVLCAVLEQLAGQGIDADFIGDLSALDIEGITKAAILTLQLGVCDGPRGAPSAR